MLKALYDRACNSGCNQNASFNYFIFSLSCWGHPETTSASHMLGFVSAEMEEGGVGSDFSPET